ncbi:MAG: DUF1080 domain-containing protein [Gemmataceae bacterium]|nr:DUF1080 domain-containing protein [Gemmataceae bacterium]
MKKLLSLVLVVALPLLLHAEGKETVLSNGKDLSGWVYKGSKESLTDKTATADERVAVENGAIVMREKDKNGKGGIKGLYTEAVFSGDFTLKLEFKAGLKADSGVYIRGPQLQIRDFARRGEQKQLKGFKNDDWNLLEVVVKGATAECSVNGEKLAPATMKVPDKGDIGLQAESGKFEFRNIRISNP